MRRLILAAASVAALALAGPASAQSPIIIKFSHVVASAKAYLGALNKIVMKRQRDVPAAAAS